MDCTKHVLIIGSGPNAVKASELETSFDAIVVINNAWRIRSDWTHLIFPYDFPEERWPQEIQSSQSVVTEQELSLIHISSPRDAHESRMPSSA